MAPRSYGQHCPIARALDVLGDRWTLLILRELLGGPRRYSDLRAALPGIATNLLAQRLRLLAAEGLAEQFEAPAPVARTLYRLTDTGWRHVPPVAGALAAYGSACLLPGPGAAVTALAGFLGGILSGFDERRARDVDEDYRVVLDGRPFDVGVRRGSLCAPRGSPAAVLHARAGDLAAAGQGGRPRAIPGSRARLDGRPAATARFMAVFGLELVEERGHDTDADAHGGARASRR